MKTFNEIFEELARHNDRSVIWNDFLDYSIEVNLLNLNDEKTQFKKNYHGNEHQYWDMITAWVTQLSEKLEKVPYYDLLGQFYEELVTSQAKSKNLGQFYTPVSVTELLSAISVDNQKKNNLHGKIANDPTCGSARMLLSAHVHSKGELILYGQELDETSAKMATLNFWSHGARGSVLHMDTLTGEIFRGWRVNRYLYHGIPVPHIEEISNEAEALDFIELNRTDNNDEVVEEVVEKVTLEPETYKPKGTGQTTLM